jgi:hypothetical protein
MKRPFILLPAVISALLFSPLSHSQSGTAEKETAKNRIAMTIATTQTTFKVGDPITLSIRVENISEYKYCENHILETGHAEWNNYILELKDVDGNVIPSVSKPLLPLRQRPELSGSRGLLCIAPKETRKESISVDQLVNVSAQGTYFVQVVHRDRGTDTDVISNIIRINIVQ